MYMKNMHTACMPACLHTRSYKGKITSAHVWGRRGEHLHKAVL